MPLFYPPIPATLQLYSDLGASGATSTLTAGSAYLQVYRLLTTVTVTQMRCWFSGSPTGNVDMGIYDSTGTNSQPNNLLAHTGAIAAVTSTFTQNLTANLTLSPGVYWLAWLDTVADSVSARAMAGTGLSPAYRTSATNLTVLPSSIGTIVTTTGVVAVSALISGGFS